MSLASSSHVTMQLTWLFIGLEFSFKSTVERVEMFVMETIAIVPKSEGEVIVSINEEWRRHLKGNVQKNKK